MRNRRYYNPYQWVFFKGDFTATCEECGESAPADLRTATACWNANMRVVHTNAAICEENLRRKRSSANTGT